MTSRIAGTRGLSLVEVTIMLLVLMTLTGVLAPSIMDFVRDAQWVKAKEDCEAIGVSVVRLTRDVGPCLKFNGTGSCTKANRVDLLHSSGPDVTPADMAGDAVAGFFGGGATATDLNWHKDDSRGDSMEHQLVDNGGGPNYPSPVDLYSHLAPGPSFGLGWRGAYLSPPIGRIRGDTVTWSTPCSSRRLVTRLPPFPGRCPAAGRTTPSASRPGPTGCTRPHSAATARTACTAAATTSSTSSRGTRARRPVA